METDPFIWNQKNSREKIIENKTFESHLNNLISSKSAKSLIIIADFDYTISKKYNNEGTKLFCTYNFYDKLPTLPEEFKKESYLLFNKYDKFDNDSSISYDERKRNLYKYYEEDLKLVVNLGLTKEKMRESFDIGFKGNYFYFRKGAEKFFKTVLEKEIKMVIVSGGIQEVIDYALQKLLGANYNEKGLIEIIANQFVYEKESGKTNNILYPVVYSLNKAEVLSQKIRNETDMSKYNILFMGDNINDIDCVKDLITDSNIFSIAFSNEPVIKKEYKEKYDMIIANDGSFDKVNVILNKII